MLILNYLLLFYQIKVNFVTSLEVKDLGVTF